MKESKRNLLSQSSSKQTMLKRTRFESVAHFQKRADEYNAPLLLSSKISNGELTDHKLSHDLSHSSKHSDIKSPLHHTGLFDTTRFPLKHVTPICFFISGMLLMFYWLHL